jgi:nickel-dependent lactate racemase
MLTGKGLTDGFLTESEIREICAEGLESIQPDGKKILCIIPDHSRTAPMDVMFRVVYGLLADRVRLLDFLVALGTHPPMPEERKSQYPKARFFNHCWDDPDQLAHIGTLSEDEVAEISGGLMREPVRITVNKMVLDYDRILIIGPTFPHEVVGFSGGSKYLFPGISGAEIIDMFHWLGALITSSAIIGHANTPVREVVEKATSLLNREPYLLALVVRDTRLAGLYAGPSQEAWRKAAGLSGKLHIIYKDKPFRQVLSCAPQMYDDLWTGAKCMYKLEPVVADGGEIIIYAPHISEISVTHGEKIRKIGYHVRDYFLKQWDKFKDVPGGVMAHSTHVKGSGTYENGIEKPRIRVTLATSIPKSICEEINLGYCDPDSIHPADWMNREEEGILYVPKAGEMLYRLKK